MVLVPVEKEVRRSQNLNSILLTSPETPAKFPIMEHNIQGSGSGTIYSVRSRPHSPKRKEKK